MLSKANIIELFKHGSSTYEIASKSGCTQQNISLILRKELSAAQLHSYKEANKLRRKKRTELRNRRKCAYCQSIFRLSHKSAIYCSQNCFVCATSKLGRVIYRRRKGESERDYHSNRARARYKKDPSFRALVARYNQIAYYKHHDRAIARSKLNYHVRRGNLIKPTECEDCHLSIGQVKRIEAHHEDYSKPLDVRWLCTVCHVRADRKRRELLTVDKSGGTISVT